MSGLDWVVTVVAAVVLGAGGTAVLASEGWRSWAASPRGRSWTRRVGVLGALAGALAAGAFSLWPPGGVYLFVVGGVLAFAAAVVAAAGAARVAADAVGESFGRRVRAFWYAAASEFRVTRYGLLVALVEFLLAAVAAGASVDPVVTAAGAFALGGLVAGALGVAVVGVFVPGGRNAAVAEDVERAS
ncbi:MAG: hypothetical protein ABEJ88_01635 [Halobacterium sp.]